MREQFGVWESGLSLIFLMLFAFNKGRHLAQLLTRLLLLSEQEQPNSARLQYELGPHSWQGPYLQSPTTLAEHEREYNGCESKHKWNTLCRSILNCWVNAFKKHFLCLPIFLLFFFFSFYFFSAVASNPSGLKGKERHYFKTFGVLKSINGEGSLLCFWAAQQDKSHPFWMQTHRESVGGFYFFVSSSTECISWWEEGIWEEELLNGKTICFWSMFFGCFKSNDLSLKAVLTSVGAEFQDQWLGVSFSFSFLGCPTWEKS